MKVKTKLMAALASLKDHQPLSNVEVDIQRSIDRHIAATATLEDKYVHEILFLVSNTPGSIAYLARRISRRLETARHPVAALKTLFLLHRLLRGGDRYFEQDLRSSCSSGDLRINLIARSSDPLWAFVVRYSMFLEERLWWVINQSGQLEPAGMEVQLQSYDLVLYRLTRCQGFLDLVMDCLPLGSLSNCHVDEMAMSIVLRESFRVYESFCEGFEIVGGVFFDLKKPARVSALDVLRKACTQTLSLHGFYEGWKRESVGKRLDYPSVKIVTDAHVASMEQLVLEGNESCEGAVTSITGTFETTISTVWVEFEEKDSEISSFPTGGIDDLLGDAILNEEESSSRGRVTELL